MHRAIGIRWMRHIGSTTPQVSMTYRWVSIVATLPLLHPSATIEGIWRIWRGKQVTRKDRGTRRTIDTISWYRVKSRAAAIVACFVVCLLRGEGGLKKFDSLRGNQAKGRAWCDDGNEEGKWWKKRLRSVCFMIRGERERVNSLFYNCLITLWSVFELMWCFSRKMWF